MKVVTISHLTTPGKEQRDILVRRAVRQIMRALERVQRLEAKQQAETEHKDQRPC
jgi:hypothetical protein